MTSNTFYDIIQTERGKELNIMKNNKHYNIVRTYNICGKEVECLCYDAGCAITYNEEEAKASGNYVAEGHTMIDKLFA